MPSIIRRYGCHDDPSHALGNAPNLSGNATLAFGLGGAVDWRPKLSDIPISDQWTTQSCVGHAMAIAIALRIRASGAWAPLPSALDIYDMALGDVRVDAGTTLFAAADAVSRLGWLTEVERPWDASKVATQKDRATWRLAHKAWLRRGMKHRRVVIDVRRAIENALNAGFGVVIGSDVGPEFEDLRPGEVYAGEPIRKGGHALAVVGYNANGVIIRNSWGSSWCDGGYGMLTWDFIESAKTRSIWVIDSMPQFS